MTSGSPAIQLGSTRRDKPLAPDAPWYRRLWHGWQKVARWIGTLLSRIITTIMYFVAVTPFAIGVKLFSDPLEMKPRPSHWTPLPPPGGLDDARRGF